MDTMVKLLHNYGYYGKSPLLMGKSRISMAMFNSFLFVYQRVPWVIREVFYSDGLVGMNLK